MIVVGQGILIVGSYMMGSAAGRHAQAELGVPTPGELLEDDDLRSRDRLDLTWVGAPPADARVAEPVPGLFIDVDRAFWVRLVGATADVLYVDFGQRVARVVNRPEAFRSL